MKRGKREKVKSPTLQSYILSMLSLVLCCAMFMSATMAWFTSEVTTTGNQIYVGTLDVDLRDADDVTLHGTTNALFEQVFLEDSAAPVSHWQDGAVALETLQVVNEGDLAFKYELKLVLSTEGSELTDLSAVTDQFEVWVLEGQLLQPTEYVDVAAENSGWTQVAVTTTDAEGQETTNDTLTAILESGTPVFSGTMTAEEIAEAKEGSEPAAHKYTIALRMKETVAIYVVVDEDGNETTESIMGKTLVLNAKLVASQLVDGQTSEEDDKTPVDPFGEQSSGETPVDSSTEGSSDETPEKPSTEEQSTDGE